MHYLLILYFWCSVHHKTEQTELKYNSYEMCEIAAEKLSEDRATTWTCIPTP